MKLTSNIIYDIIPFLENASDAIVSIYNGNDLGIAYKKDQSPITKADLASNSILVEGLNKMDKNIPIISEELDIASYEIREKYNIYWLIDPLDGTKGFIKKNGDFAINIALIQDSKPIFGIIYIPLSKELYWAWEGEGAYLYKEGNSSRIFTKKMNISDPNLTICCSRSHLGRRTSKYMERFNSPVIVKMGSSIKLTLIAKGDADVYPRFGTTMEWDIASGQIIIEEAGGHVLRISDNKPLVYNKKDLRNPDFVAFGDFKTENIFN